MEHAEMFALKVISLKQAGMFRAAKSGLEKASIWDAAFDPQPI